MTFNLIEWFTFTKRRRKHKAKIVQGLRSKTRRLKTDLAAKMSSQVADFWHAILPRFSPGRPTVFRRRYFTNVTNAIERINERRLVVQQSLLLYRRVSPFAVNATSGPSRHVPALLHFILCLSRSRCSYRYRCTACVVNTIRYTRTLLLPVYVPVRESHSSAGERLNLPRFIRRYCYNSYDRFKFWSAADRTICRPQVGENFPPFYSYKFQSFTMTLIWL